MGQLGAMVGVGVILGPLLGGLLSTDVLALPFFLGAGLALLAFLLVLLLLPESQPLHPTIAEQSVAPRKKYLSMLANPAGLLLLLVFITSFGLTNFQGMFGLYVVDKFTFDTHQVGSLWMVMGLVLILAQGLLTGLLSKRFGDLTLIRAGLIGGSLGFILVAKAVDYITILLALAWFMFCLALIGPALNAHLSHFASQNQGAVMGVNSAMNSLGRVLGPLLGGYLYDLRLEYPFYSGSAILLLGFILSLLTLVAKTHPRLKTSI
jgi:DHA1 family multidrug resistance protein-like MFS transporter